MSISATAKKTLAALVLVAPLTLAACGSAAEDPADGSATTTAETEAATGEGTGEAGAEDDAERVDTEGAAENPAGGSGDGVQASEGETVTPQSDPAAALDEAFADGQVTYAQLPPVEGGAPADEADRAAIEGLVRGMYDTTTVHGFLNYLPDHTCGEVLEAQGGREVYDLSGIPDMPLNQMPTYVNAQPRIDSVTDVQVDGNVASATVTATSGGETEVATQRFQREGDAWTFCN